MKDLKNDAFIMGAFIILGIFWPEIFKIAHYNWAYENRQFLIDEKTTLPL